MASWRDYAHKIEPTPEGCANSANSAKSPDVGPPVPPNGTNGTNGGGLPSVIRAGLDALATAPAPRLIAPERWPRVVADAQRIANDGWAAKALALGWSALDLFGAVPDKDGDARGDGLAVWLAGRKLIALDERCAAAADKRGGRFYFHRPRAPGAVLMWSLGRRG